jgi:hypothetical protein|tara:strand:- start:1544 stop:1780 length:237 start_codon:yes stop_codon:yes gene_type:complete
MSLSKEDEEYCEAMFEMMATDGWKILLKDYEGNRANINSVEWTKDNDDLRFRKGQLDVIASILTLRDQVETLYEQNDL